MTKSAVAFEAWQYVSGPKFSFVLPDFVKRSGEIAETIYLSRREKVAAHAVQIQKERNLKICPLTAKMLYEIFDRLIDRNSLRSFMDEKKGPGLGFYPICVEEGEGATADELHAVSIHPDLLFATKSEDQIAFVLAHEIAHILFGHVENLIDYKPIYKQIKDGQKQNKNMDAVVDSLREKRRQARIKNEKQADEYGMLMAWNAGYSPFEAAAGLKLILNRKGVFTRLNSEVLDDGHGGLSARRKRIHSILDSTSEKRENFVVQSARLMEAQKELNRVWQDPESINLSRFGEQKD